MNILDFFDNTNCLLQVQLHCQHFLTTRCCFFVYILCWNSKYQKNLVLTFLIGLNWFRIFDGWALVPLLSRHYDVKKRLIKKSDLISWNRFVKFLSFVISPVQCRISYRNQSVDLLCKMANLRVHAHFRSVWWKIPYCKISTKLLHKQRKPGTNYFDSIAQLEYSWINENIYNTSFLNFFKQNFKSTFYIALLKAGLLANIIEISIWDKKIVARPKYIYDEKNRICGWGKKSSHGRPQKFFFINWIF